MFLIRAAFWLSVVILLIPADPETGTDAPRVTAFDALIAARATIADMSGFCTRNPDVCTTGSAAMDLFGQKAENGVRMLYRYIDGEEGAQPANAMNGTLTPDDMAPEWRGPTGKGSA
jgi:hypothetical protein